MRQAFAESVELEIVVKTDAISFPSPASGLNAVEDILVRRFGADNENVHTFCLSEPEWTGVAQWDACPLTLGFPLRHAAVSLGGWSARPCETSSGKWFWKHSLKLMGT
jgi:hypothetical protein